MQITKLMPRGRTLAALTAAATAVGCSGNGEADVPDGAMPAPDPAPVAVTALSPESGPPGTDVTIRAQGFEPNSTVDIGFGVPRSEYDVVRQAQTDAQGRVDVTVEVPSWAETGRDYVFVVADTDTQPKAISSEFRVGEGKGALRIHGQITDEGVECPALRADDGKLYTLVGRTEGIEIGQVLTVEGTLAEASICMQGTTIEVTDIDRP